MGMTRAQLLDDSALLETTLSSDQVYDGCFFQVFHDKVALPDGVTAIREHMKHPGAVMVMPVFDNGDVLVERQYRYPLRQVFVEFPAGKKDTGEEPLRTGQRELLEETGYIASEWEYVTDIHNAIAYCDEVIHFYIARGLTKQSEQVLDKHEFLQVLRVPFVELESWMKQGWVPDVKTQLGIFWLKDKLTSNGSDK